MIRMPRSRHVGRIAIAACTALFASPASAAEFYAGKTIEFVVGNYPGGGFDIYARTVARHFARHIPGNPTIVVKNMPGAGSAKAGHYIGTLAPKDGTSIGAVTPGAIIGPLLDDKPDALFDPTKVTWIGTANSGSRICATYETSKIKSFDDAMNNKTRLGGVAVGDAVHDYAFLIKRTTKAQIEVVTGYKGTLDLALAMERGEIDGVCGWDWSSVKSQKPDWLRDGKINILAQIGPESNRELTDRGAPPVWKFIKDPISLKVAQMVVSQQAFTRPYFMPTGVPSEQMNVLRTGFESMTRDPQFLADANKTGIDVSPLPGTKVQELIQALFATPKDVVEQAKKAIRP